MRKLNDLLNKPITWKASLIVNLVISFVYVIWMAFTFGWFKVLVEKIEGLFSNLKTK